MLPLISIIIPVYNVHKYLDRCIKSIINQTYTNLEIILVDDGSTDGSSEICDRWEKTDKRIIVIHQKNAGSGAARNKALEIASGDFVGFVDSDDIIDSHMYSKLMALFGAQIDIVECEYRSFGDEEDPIFTLNNTYVRHTKIEALREHIKENFYRQVIWNKLYRKDIVENIRFPENKSIDDEYWTYKVLAKARNTIHCDSILYAYRQQSRSIMHSIDISKKIQTFEANIERYDYICKEFPVLKEIACKELILACLFYGQLSMREKTIKSKEIFVFVKNVFERLECSLKNFKVTHKCWIMGARINFKLICYVRNVLHIGIV